MLLHLLRCKNNTFAFMSRIVQQCLNRAESKRIIPKTDELRDRVPAVSIHSQPTQPFGDWNKLRGVMAATENSLESSIGRKSSRRHQWQMLDDGFISDRIDHVISVAYHRDASFIIVNQHSKVAPKMSGRE